MLGAAGFTPAEREHVGRVLDDLPEGWLRWRLAPFGEADAWWVSGERTRAQEDGSLQVAPAAAHDQPIVLNLNSVDRPVAFSTPLAAMDFEPRCVFSLEDVAGMHAALHMFATWLQPLHAVYVLGAMVMRRAASLRHNVHHVNHRGVLLAVLDYREGRIGVLPAAQPADLWAAEWDKRPPTAHDLPPNFISYTPAQLIWSYVRRTERDLLPVRYRHDTIYFRHPPHVPLRWLRDSQLVLLRELNAEPGTLHALRQRTGLAEDVLAHDLSCMYFTGSITTTASKAAPPGQSLAGGGPTSMLGGATSTPQAQRDSTAPVPLDPHR